MFPCFFGGRVSRLSASIRRDRATYQRVRRWKEEEYPAIHTEAAAAGATIFFADEAGVRTDHHSGTTWAPVGRQGDAQSRFPSSGVV